MSGVCNYYQFKTCDNTCFLESVNIFTSRYKARRNYVQLYPHNNKDIEINRTFVNTFLADLNAEVLLCTDWSAPSFPRPRLVREIQVHGDKVRDTIDRLFQQGQISADVRSTIEAPLRELESCLDYASKASKDITTAQKCIIETFIEPYKEILIKNMEPWKIKASISIACVVVEGYVDPEKIFNRILSCHWVGPDVKCTEPIINKEWAKELKDEVLESLYTIGKVLSGKANLEGALLQSGRSLPTLEVQKQVVVELFPKTPASEESTEKNSTPQKRP